MDGVFEYLSSQHVVDMVASYSDPRDACAAIAGESYRLWLEHENRTDDITIIIVHIKDLCGYARDEKSRLIIRPASIGIDTDDCHHTVSNARNAATVVPSPTLALPLDGG
ncbi:hypothetical protein MLD38_027372 [Melastoma candidum]|uniref:Uncharacterized protein n=1 Tax=Melastoma candidum TaxID=119954 RepID=A0ACB9P3D4_9MYRT|nr:hypothetical protein MLD38_027372 [Melastoma candidum]